MQKTMLGYWMGQFLFGLVAGIVVGLIMEWVIDWAGLLPNRSARADAKGKSATNGRQVNTPANPDTPTARPSTKADEE
jgi:hypothetical protein